MHISFHVMQRKMTAFFLMSLLFAIPAISQTAKKYDASFVENLKKEALTSVGAKEKAVQEMVDMVFSFGELGFQEIETWYFRYSNGLDGQMGQRFSGNCSGQRY